MLVKKGMNVGKGDELMFLIYLKYDDSINNNKGNLL